MATRRERVVLTLDDDFTPGMARAAGATALLNRELNSLSGNSVQASRSSQTFIRDVQSMSRESRGAERSINQLTGRLRLFADAAAIFGPAAVPLGGVLAAGVAGFASQLGFAAVAGGVLVGSMQGLGDALTALSDAKLEPTAENLAKVETALSKLSPAAANFAIEANGMLPVLRGIRDAGAEGLFPGLTDSLDDLERLAPVVSRIFSEVGSALGDIASGGAASLASDRWTGFFEFLADEAPTAISELASTVGSLTHGLAELWMAFTPLNNDVSGWLMDVADGFDSWATGLDQTDGFREFIDYIRATGPQVADTMGALGDAVLQIVQAAAPLGGPSLAAIEGLANALAAIADSPVGPTLLAAASAMAIFNRSAMLVDATQKRVAASSLTMNQALGRGAALMGGLALASTGAADGLGVTNTASLALMGTIAGPWGAAVGAGIGLLLDWNAENERVEASTRAFGDSLEAMSLSELQSGFSEIQRVMSALDEDNPLQGQLGERIALLQEELEVREAAAAASRRLADQSAVRDSIEAETAALYNNIAAMQAKRDESLRSFSAETNYAQSLLDAKEALKENGRAFNLTTEAGLANRRVVEQQASAWNELNRTQGQTPAQARKARAALIETAESLGASKREARQYANQLLDIPNDLKTKIALDVDTAVQRAKAIKAELASIDRNIDVYVNVRRPNAGGFGPQVTGSADGSFVPKTGKPYADRHLYLLADGEGVTTNRRGETDRFKDVISGINAGYSRSVVRGMLAEGGIAGDKKREKRKPQGGLFAADNTAALEEAINRLTMVSEDQTRALDDATAKQEFWASKMSDLAQATVAGFNTGLFEKSDNPWAAGASGGPLGNLTRDIAGLQERSGLQSQLAAMGLSGDALSALLSEGTNSDISALLNSGQVSQYADLYNQRAALQGSVGASAGQQAYGAEASAAQATVRVLEAGLRETNLQVLRMSQKLDLTNELLAEVGDDFGAQLSGSAAKGHRDKKARGGPR